jgi:hypothetical protein
MNVLLQAAQNTSGRKSAVPEDMVAASEGNPPLEPRGLEVEFFPKEEVLHEKVKIYG